MKAATAESAGVEPAAVEIAPLKGATEVVVVEATIEVVIVKSTIEIAPDKGIEAEATVVGPTVVPI